MIRHFSDHRGQERDVERVVRERKSFRCLSGGKADIVEPGPLQSAAGLIEHFGLQIEQVEAAVTMIHRGAKLIATNLDNSCPTPNNGIRPGCGAMVAMLEAATGIKAFSVGKPSPFMMRAARKELGLNTDQTVMIGDTMETDIKAGVYMGYKTILVLSGIADKDKMHHYGYSPSLVVDSVDEIRFPLDWW